MAHSVKFRHQDNFAFFNFINLTSDLDTSQSLSVAGFKLYWTEQIIGTMFALAVEKQAQSSQKHRI
jgi:hypothetical protein